MCVCVRGRGLACVAGGCCQISTLEVPAHPFAEEWLSGTVPAKSAPMHVGYKSLLTLLVDEAFCAWLRVESKPCTWLCVSRGVASRSVLASPAACSCCRLFVLDLLHMSERSYTHAVLHVQVLTLKLTRWSANSRGSFIQILPRPPAATGVEGF